MIDSIGAKLEANSTKFTEMETKINSIKLDLVLMSNNLVENNNEKGLQLNN
jgi:hypothetical protein